MSVLPLVDPGMMSILARINLKAAGLYVNLSYTALVWPVRAKSTTGSALLATRVKVSGIIVQMPYRFRFTQPALRENHGWSRDARGEKADRGPALKAAAQ